MPDSGEIQSGIDSDRGPVGILECAIGNDLHLDGFGETFKLGVLAANGVGVHLGRRMDEYPQRGRYIVVVF
ncbi:MAG: hypothetical protein H0X25_07450 [Acidobacteriales bacterium]|nr:hypothetical protein [Terriglobales bacterium]